MPDCDIILSKLKAALISASPVLIPEDSYNDIFDFLVAQTKADSFQNRLLPLTGMKQVDDASTAATEGNLAGYGYAERLADGIIALTIQFPAAVCRLKAINKLVGMKGYAFMVDEKKQLVGAKAAGGVKGLKIESLSVDNTNSLWRDGANVKTVKLKITFGSDTEFIETLRVLQVADFDEDLLSGLQTVELDKVGELTYRVQTACNGVNLYNVGTLATALADKDLWRVTNLVTGASLAVTTVAPIAEKGAFELTLSAPPTAPYRLGVTLAAPSVLEGKGAAGIEQMEVFIDNVKA